MLASTRTPLQAILALSVAAMAGGCAIVPLAVSAVVGPIEGRPLVRLNASRATQPAAAVQADAAATPAATPSPIRAL